MSAGQPRSGWLPIHRHALFGVSALIGLAALITALFLQAELAYSIGANAFFAAYSALVLAEMPLLSADYLSRNARATDQPLAVIFIITFMVVGVAVGALFQIINGQGVGPAGLVFALASIPLGWFTIHAMTALHYAHVYWSDDAGETTEKKPAGGFEFPGTKHPQGWDFLYFSTVIGMTAQTSDTSVTTAHMRRIVLAHSIVSFFFNTVIVAAAVNLAVSLGD
ncbi:DUF1345 domain-containing protein [Aquamicrobium lusatiense]|uniref:DUF1345 domain-containing protein n=1 Tax=Aquamicrobium TaxID=69278 RepID=UPI0024583678|nr:MULTISPECIES: DUF1345 domain-containing protein [Aquamicrobium]MCK9552981.1 DUF1345 domain-containing protein [Aquamicrobium sp.]MDH4990349.1 DUF1345 domain-containing protein [Aquamicrobium lusatiense]